MIYLNKIACKDWYRQSFLSLGLRESGFESQGRRTEKK